MARDDNRGPRGRGGGRSGGPDRQRREPPVMPDPQAVHYFTPDGRVRPELLDGEAEAAARGLAEARLKTTQLRRYYDDVLNLRERLREEARRAGDDREAAFQTLLADFKMLKAKAAYAHGRSDKTFPRQFLQFFVDHVAAVRTASDFEAFCKHFEAVIAFHKFYGED